MSDQTRWIEIPERTAAKVDGRIEDTEFDSIDEYATFALDQLLAELRQDSGDPEVKPVTDETDEDSARESVADQLESLGYL